MRKLLFVASLAVAPAFCLPVCTTHTALDYMTGESPCSVTIGGFAFTVSGVSWVSDGGDGLLAPASDVNLTPLVQGGSFVGFKYERIGGEFSATASQQLKTLLTWTIDPPPPIMDGFGMSLDPTGFASIVADVSYGEKKEGQSIPSPLNTQSISVVCDDGTTGCPTLTASFKFVVPSNYVHADLHLTLGNRSVPSTSAGGSADVTLIPEPSAFGFAASGLLALAALARRRRRS